MEKYKAGKELPGNKRDASKRGQVMFMNRDNIMNLHVVTSLPRPRAALPQEIADSHDDIPYLRVGKSHAASGVALPVRVNHVPYVRRQRIESGRVDGVCMGTYDLVREHHFSILRCRIGMVS